jgi:hypothetical protein
MHDPTGERYGQLTVMGYSGRKYKNGDRYVTVLCDCGTEKEMTYPSVKSPRGSRSCGCQRWKGVHLASGTPLYRVWLAMRRRCYSPADRSYSNYGGRGITICRRWRSYSAFAADMEPTFKPGLVIDRVHNNKGYSKANCRWVTRAESNRNTRANISVLVDGQVLCFAEIVRLYGTRKYRSALHRYRKGLSVADAIDATDLAIKFTEIV